jgi:DNA helicase-2/ATP-dependent DNA helicase PcrA
VANTSVNAILENLNSNQLEAVTATEHPLIIIAGAGSGKTRVLTRRIAYRIATGDAEARHTLAITFTKKASNELKQRLTGMELRDQIEAHTFHAAALRILQRFWESNHLTPFDLLESKFKMVSDALTAIGTTTSASTGFAQKKGSSQPPVNTVLKRSLISAITTEIEWAKAHGLNPSSYHKAAIAQNREIPLTPSEVSEVFKQYEILKQRARKLDYDDLITQATWALNTDKNFAATERYRIRHLYIDEFQDVNLNQMNLVNAILGDRIDLCVVGDPNQAIYSWNGADPTLLSNLPQRYPESKTVVLSHNYRSTPQILALAQCTLTRTSSKERNSGSLVANLPDGPVPVIRAFSDDKTEAQSVARLVKKAHQPNVKWSDIAVLARTNSQLVTFQSAFKESAIPAFISGETSYLSQSEIRSLLYSLERGTGPLVGASLYGWLEDVVAKSSEIQSGDGAASDNLNLFLNLSKEFLTSSPTADSRSLALWLRSEAQNALEESTHDAVTLTTFHKAKGLEWKSVFIVGMEDGYVPIAKAESNSALAEELRLLYVAITRAKKELTLTWARSRKYNDRSLKREPSPYLAKLEDMILKLSGHLATQEHALSVIQRTRKDLESKPEKEFNQTQQNILQSLRLWRSNKSKELGVPAHLILHDHAIESITLKNPDTITALSKIAGVGQVRASRFGDDLLKCLKN